MAFNYYAKLKRTIEGLEPGWYIKRINEPTATKRFDGTTRHYDHYYRLMYANGKPVPYGKFQQLEKLASLLGKDVGELPIKHP